MNFIDKLKEEMNEEDYDIDDEIEIPADIQEEIAKAIANNLLAGNNTSLSDSGREVAAMVKTMYMELHGLFSRKQITQIVCAMLGGR